MNEKQCRSAAQDQATMKTYRVHLAKELGLNERQICQNGLDNPLMSAEARMCIANDLRRTQATREAKKTVCRVMAMPSVAATA